MGAVRILPSETIVERRGQALYARSPFPLGPYPVKITERLEQWARQEPDRLFLCRRDVHGQWQGVTYGAALARIRAIGQSLIERGLSVERPVVILSGNSIEHALLALAAMYCGVLYAPVAPAYSLLAHTFTTLSAIVSSLRPGLVFADDGQRYARAISSVCRDSEIVACRAPDAIAATGFAALEQVAATAAVDEAHARVKAATIAKVLYTSGSTGAPKGVINTQQMLCANQEMIRTVLPLLAEDPPVLCDWLPWNHTFGGNHNFGIVLYNGGTLYIDDGTPTPDGFATTLANLRDVATTAYFNVPRGYELLVPALVADAEFRAHFFSRVELLFCAAAGLRQQVADDLNAAAVRGRGGRIPLVTGLGATESAPFALCAGDADFTGGRVGVPVPGVELKLAPVGPQFEARLRGPTITPGYWRDDERTRAAFDEEGFYKLGDALGFVDPADPTRGFVFEGRLSEDFKLATGTWVRVGPLRAALLAHFAGFAQDVVIAGHDRAYVAALIFPAAGADLRQPSEVRRHVQALLSVFASEHAASSTMVRRAVILDGPPAIDAQELTDKGSVNQKAVLANRAAVVEQLYADDPPVGIIDIDLSSRLAEQRDGSSARRANSQPPTPNSQRKSP